MNKGGDVNKVWEINTLKRKPKVEEARKILEAIAKQVQPIMRKHHWRVKVLSEFCPKNPRLLGVNVGAGIHVKLRLRRPNRDEEFLPFDSILDTMLHELCHNAHRPHNTKFYKLWGELRQEYEDLMSKGISGTGEAFDLPGKHLGGSFPTPPQARPMRLGGDSALMSALSPTQAAAMAAERRYRDNIWCGSESCDSIEEDEIIDQKPSDTKHSSRKSKTHHGSDVQILKEMPQKRSRSSDKMPGSEFIDLTAGATISGSVLNRDEISQKKNFRRGSTSQCPSNIHKEELELPADSLTSEVVLPRDATGNTEKDFMWECLKCTLLNPPLAPICELCSTRKPKDVDSINRTWSCKFCTLDNSVELEKCGACGDWRYSHGPPVATSVKLDT